MPARHLTRRTDRRYVALRPAESKAASTPAIHSYRSGAREQG
jgi:hypothetical protein